MSARSALVHVPDAGTREAVVRRHTAHGFRVTESEGADPATAVAGLGPLEAVVCAVDRPGAAAFPGGQPGQWYADVMTCLTPPFRLLRAAVPALRESGQGRIVLLGSGWTTAGRPEQTGASAVHGAVVALVKTLARDLGPDGITVNEVVGDPAAPPAPEAVAQAVSYLCAPAAGAVVGQLLTLGRGGELRP
jgi:NAD(P)-dependent dehydrogenase (short-subunit alcohol dehydrogenase family)